MLSAINSSYIEYIHYDEEILGLFYTVESCMMSSARM